LYCELCPFLLGRAYYFEHEPLWSWVARWAVAVTDVWGGRRSSSASRESM